MSTPTTLLHVAVMIGSHRADVAVTAEARVLDLLAHERIGAPGAEVVNSLGESLAPDAPLADHVRHGDVLWVVDRDSLGTAAAGRQGATHAPSRVHAGAQAWLVCALAYALCAVVVINHAGVLGDDAWVYPDWVRYALAGALGAMGLVLSMAVRPMGAQRGTFHETFSAPALGFATGFLLSPPGQHGATLLAIVLATLSAASLAIMRFATSRRTKDASLAAAAVMALLWAVLAGMFAVALLTDLPGYVVPTLVLGATPLIIRSMPSASLDIPDDQLLDMPFLAKTATKVRGPAPRSPARIRWQRVMESVQFAERRKAAGLLAASALVVAMSPAVIASYEPATLRGWGTLAVLALVVLFLALSPRSFRRTVEKVVPRIALLIVLIQVAFVLAARGELAWWTLGIIAASVGIAFLAIPLMKGYRSVRWSRLGDAVEGLAVVLVFPAALVAAGAIEGLQTLTAR